MGALAALLVGLGIIGLIWAAMQKFKSGRLAKAPFAKTGDVAAKGDKVAGEKGAISVEGDVKCGAPLISPVTGTPCLYYELKVVGTWKDGEKTESKDYLVEKKAAAFGLDDGTGVVGVDLREGGDLDPFEKTFDETKKEGFFADLKNAVGKKEPIMFGKYAFENPPMSKADKFTCTEYVLKVQPKLFVLGKHEQGVITAPKWTSLIATHKSRELLLGSTAKAAKNFGIGGGAAVALGVILGVVSMFIAPKPAEAAHQDDVAIAADAPSADPGSDVQAAAADDEGNTVAAAAEGSELCQKAARCCEVISGEGSAACDSLLLAGDATCKSSLASFTRAVKKAHPKQLGACK